MVFIHVNTKVIYATRLSYQYSNAIQYWEFLAEFDGFCETLIKGAEVPLHSFSSHASISLILDRLSGGRFAEFINKVHLSFSLTHNLELVIILLKACLCPEMDLIFLQVNMKVVNDCDNYGQCFSNIDTSSQFFHFYIVGLVSRKLLDTICVRLLLSTSVLYAHHQKDITY